MLLEKYAGEILKKVKQQHPLVHCITNYVTVNDVANIILACGGSPIMADDIAEAEEITTITNALVINIGTLNSRTIESMLLAGKCANKLGHPVVLDPVGAGASRLRTETAERLINEVRFSVIRGNISEIKTVYMGAGSTKGVDADISDAVTHETLQKTINMARRLSEKNSAAIVITGATDIIADTHNAYIIENGTPQMGRITGTGCMLSGVIGAWIAANPAAATQAAALAVSAMGLCGELAAKKSAGTGSLRMHIIDAISNMDADTLLNGMKCRGI